LPPCPEQPSHGELVKPHGQGEIIDMDALVSIVIAGLHDLGRCGPHGLKP
jgi:hypothetical protein